MLTAQKITDLLTEKGMSVPDVGAGGRNIFVPEQILESILFLALTIEPNAPLRCDAHK